MIRYAERLVERVNNRRASRKQVLDRIQAAVDDERTPRPREGR
jgi:hypothetical protein